MVWFSRFRSGVGVVRLVSFSRFGRLVGWLVVRFGVVSVCPISARFHVSFSRSAVGSFSRSALFRFRGSVWFGPDRTKPTPTTPTTEPTVTTTVRNRHNRTTNNRENEPTENGLFPVRQPTKTNRNCHRPTNQKRNGEFNQNRDDDFGVLLSP